LVERRQAKTLASDTSTALGKLGDDYADLPAFVASAMRKESVVVTARAQRTFCHMLYSCATRLITEKSA
jgi:hypothetical protein